jgi:hypothetical protein
MPDATALRAQLTAIQQSASAPAEVDVTVHVDGRMCASLRLANELIVDESAALRACLSERRVRECLARALSRQGRESDAAAVLDVDDARSFIDRVVLRRKDDSGALISLSLRARRLG